MAKIFRLIAISTVFFMYACGDDDSNSVKPNVDDTPSCSSSKIDSSDDSTITAAADSTAADSVTADSVAESSSSKKEKSSSSAEKVEYSSSDTDEPDAESSSDAAEPAAESSSSEEIESSSSEEQEPTLSEECVEMRSTQDKFIPLEDVFDCVLPKEKVVFVIRHGERNKNDDGSNGDLNANGKDQSAYLGKKLAEKSKEEFYYVSTKTYRTLNTDIYISRGKGETFLDSATVFNNDSSYHFVKDEDYVEKWFVKNSGSGDCKGVTSWARFAIFAYDTTACPNDFYNVDAKTAEFIDKHFMYEDIPNVTVVATHDKFITPFLISLTDRKIGLEAHEYVKKNGYDNDWNQGVFKHWPNYLTGAAIIVNENNERSFVPVRGLNTGYLGYHCQTGTEKGYACSMWEKDVK